MARITEQGDIDNTVSPRGAFVVKMQKGTVVAQGWPAPRPNQQGKLGVSARDRFAAVQANLKNLSGEEVATMAAAVADLNARNTGVRGESQIRARDVMTRNAYGYMWALYDQTTNRLIYSCAVRDRVSAALDWTMPIKGSILSGYLNQWQPSAAGEEGWVLCVTYDLSLPFTSGPPVMVGHTLQEKIVMSPQEQAVQDSLDVLGWTPGGILYRAADKWRILPVGSVGQVLTLYYDPDTGILLPSWQTYDG